MGLQVHHLGFTLLPVDPPPPPPSTIPSPAGVTLTLAQLTGCVHEAHHMFHQLRPRHQAAQGHCAITAITLEAQLQQRIWAGEVVVVVCAGGRGGGRRMSCSQTQGRHQQ
jgi:hypothetical protein